MSVKPDLEIRHCRILIAVSEGAGIGRAAKSLGVAQSTVSEALFALERVVGQRMLVRRKGAPATLTAAAETLLPFARELVRSADAALTALEPQAAVTLRLGASESVTSYLLPPALRALQRRYPIIQFQISTGVCGDLQEQLLAGNLDMVVTLQPVSADGSPELKRQQLGSARVCLVTEPQSPLAGRRWFASNSADAPLILPDPRGALNEIIEQWQRDQGSGRRIMSAGSIDGVKQRAALGDGIGVLVALSVEADLSRGELVELVPAAPIPTLNLEALTLARNDNATLDMLSEELSRQLSSRAD